MIPLVTVPFEWDLQHLPNLELVSRCETAEERRAHPGRRDLEMPVGRADLAVDAGGDEPVLHDVGGPLQLVVGHRPARCQDRRGSAAADLVC